MTNLSSKQFNKTESCPTCRGRGWDMVEHEEEGHDRVKSPCDDCNASGRVPIMSKTELADQAAANYAADKAEYDRHIANGLHAQLCPRYCRWEV